MCCACESGFWQYCYGNGAFVSIIKHIGYKSFFYFSKMSTSIFQCIDRTWFTLKYSHWNPVQWWYINKKKNLPTNMQIIMLNDSPYCCTRLSSLSNTYQSQKQLSVPQKWKCMKVYWIVSFTTRVKLRPFVLLPYWALYNVFDSTTVKPCLSLWSLLF